MLYKSPASFSYHSGCCNLFLKFRLKRVSCLCHSGALFSAEDQAKYAKITEKLAELCTVFTQVANQHSALLMRELCAVLSTALEISW